VAIKRPIYIIVDACHSGSFIKNYHLDHNATAIVCSTKSEELTLTTPDITLHEHGIFSQSFWTAIGEGKSIFGAYNKAGWDVRELVAKLLLIPYLLGRAETPVFDDIQSGNEFYGVSSVSGSKIPGPNGEGNCLSSKYMGNCEWAYPWISSCSPTQYYAWPPPASIPIWAVIQNDTALSNVTILMLPPDLQPGNETLNLETYQMQNTKGNGNFSIQIPSLEFTNHASGPSIFSFFLAPSQEDGMSAYMREIDVVFTQDGQPAPDTVPPGVFITRPLSLDTVNGIININGTVCDDACLLRTELHIDDVLFQTLNLPVSTTSLFQFQLDTSQLSNGCHNITVVAFDTSNNSANETLTVDAVNNVHDVAVVDVQPFKTCTPEGPRVNVTAIVVNHGTFSENFNMSMYMNSTWIGSKIVTNIPAGGVTSVDFVWNTSGLPKGNYTITANAIGVTGETDVQNNIFGSDPAHITIPGDVNGDRKVDVKDVYAVAKSYGTSLEGPNPPDRTFSPNCDINDDLKVDVKDYYTACKHYGETDP
jgi:hypothetical protein